MNIIHYQVGSILRRENSWTLFIIKREVFYGKEIHEHYSVSSGKYSMERKFVNIIHYQVGSILWKGNSGKLFIIKWKLIYGGRSREVLIKRHVVEVNKETYSLQSWNYPIERKF